MLFRSVVFPIIGSCFMPNKKVRKSNQNGSMAKISAAVAPTVFKALVTGTVASFTGSVQFLGGTLASVGVTLHEGRLSSVSPNWTFWRLKRLRFRANPSTTSGAITVISWVPSSEGITLPTTLGDAVATLPNAICWGYTVQTTPGDWCNVPPALLKGQLEWYRTSTSGPEAGFMSNGYLVFFSSGTSGFVNAEIEGEMEFKGPVDSAIALARTREAVVSSLKDDYVLVPRVLSTGISPALPRPGGGGSAC